MTRIALIHTVRNVYESFADCLHAAMPNEELKIFNVLDEFLASDAAPSESGYFTPTNRQRLWLQLQAAVLTNADLIVTTCSQLSTAAREMASQIPVPLITIDGCMIAETVRHGAHIALISSAAGTVKPIAETIRIEAARQHKEIEINVYCDESAIQALKSGDRQTHDEKIRSLAAQIHDCDAALIAQASGAHMGPEVEKITGLKVYTSIDLCIGEIRAFVETHRAR